MRLSFANQLLLLVGSLLPGFLVFARMAVFINPRASAWRRSASSFDRRLI
jgi:hypothetical protein